MTDRRVAEFRSKVFKHCKGLVDKEYQGVERWDFFNFLSENRHISIGLYGLDGAVGISKIHIYNIPDVIWKHTFFADHPRIAGEKVLAYLFKDVIVVEIGRIVYNLSVAIVDISDSEAWIIPMYIEDEMDENLVRMVEISQGVRWEAAACKIVRRIESKSVIYELVGTTKEFSDSLFIHSGPSGGFTMAQTEHIPNVCKSNLRKTRRKEDLGVVFDNM